MHRGDRLDQASAQADPAGGARGEDVGAVQARHRYLQSAAGGVRVLAARRAEASRGTGAEKEAGARGSGGVEFVTSPLWGGRKTHERSESVFRVGVSPPPPHLPPPEKSLRYASRFFDLPTRGR